MFGNKELDVRFGTRDLDQEELDAVDAIRKAVRSLAGKIDKMTPDGRNKSLALTALEDVEMRSVKAISRGTEEQAVAKPPAAARAAKKESAVQPAGEKKLDLRTKEGRAAKAAAESAAQQQGTPIGGNVALSDESATDVSAPSRPRSRRARTS